MAKRYPSERHREQRGKNYAMLAVIEALEQAISRRASQVAGAETPSVRLRAILDPWLQNLNDRDRDA